VWCEAAIAAFDTNRTAPANIGSATHPVYLFAAARPAALATDDTVILTASDSNDNKISV
jgi:hypothetical protein